MTNQKKLIFCLGLGAGALLLFVAISYCQEGQSRSIEQQAPRLPNPSNFKPAVQEGILEINTILMESTFKIEGPDSLGTGFVLGRLYPNEPSKAKYVLVTAAHVLESIKGETAVIVMRQKSTSGKWNKLPVSLKIRKDNKPLWVRHPTADVAAMYIDVPDNVITSVLLSTDILIDDEALRHFEVHPGDQLFSLGLPFGAEANEAGIPILRSGRIASYPLLPSREVKTFLFDFAVFSGDSGGPVYFFE